MLPATIVQNYDQRRLRNLLIVFFVGLAIPTAAIIWQAYGQLKWEAFYQHRAQAEALTDRIDTEIARNMSDATNRSFADFQFLNVAEGGKVLQRSPLAAFPVNQDIPGTIGHFQVDKDGAFSTPLLPNDDTQFADLGIDPAGQAQRLVLAAQIQQILSENELAIDRVSQARRVKLAPEPALVTNSSSNGFLRSATDSVEEFSAGEVDRLAEDLDETSVTSVEIAEEEADKDSILYSQDVFESLNRSMPASAPAESAFSDSANSLPKHDTTTSLGRVEDLRLDEELQKKSIDVQKENDDLAERKRQGEARFAQSRSEQVALPIQQVEAGSVLPAANDANSNLAITTFASEIDPYEFSLLKSGHLVLFRNVWRDSERIIQGLLIDRGLFVEETVARAFRSTPLANMSNLIIGYQGEIIHEFRGGQDKDYLRASSDLQNTLLYRRTLTAPFEGLELVFSINQLPRAPGANVLVWSTVVIGLVFIAGFFTLYRLGMSQLRLARQQQDFVSAVSHELKTPLTSIRMYSEMLKEGWADEQKQKQYYEYIHDESERLTRLIANVLQLAKISRNDPEFDIQAVTVGELMSQIESKISSQIERGGFDLQIDRASDIDNVLVHVDTDCFAQVVINLVDNAIKFSRDATTKAIHISARRHKDDEITFSVRDHGPGIPKNQLKKIFQLFYRTESELTRETVGTGIGLAIVHQLVSAMRGRVDIVNRDPGAQFDVSFPQMEARKPD